MSEELSYNSIEEMLSNLPKNFKILEEVIDLEIQREFFEAAKKIDKQLEDPDVGDLIKQLNNPESTEETLKETILKLSAIDSVEAYRALENFQEESTGTIKSWAILAFQQSRMIMQSSFLEEQTVYISTGLGGKDQMLRYFIVFPFNPENEITTLQKNLLGKELDFSINSNHGILEEFNLCKNYATAKVLIPITAPVSEIFNEIIEECNQFNSFLNPNMVITNTKVLNDDEIISLINNGPSN